MKFCDNHNIKYKEYVILNSSYYHVKFKDVKDPKFDKSLVNKSDTFIYILFTKKDYDETDYLYKPFEKLYESTIPDEFGWYSYDSYGTFHVPEPIHCYVEDELKYLFSAKNLSSRNVVETKIPFNTLDQLEHLYGIFYQFSKDVKDFYNSDTFQQAIQTYKNNINMTKELKQANENLVEKTLQIVKRKQELSEDFTKQEPTNVP